MRNMFCIHTYITRLPIHFNIIYYKPTDRIPQQTHIFPNSCLRRPQIQLGNAVWRTADTLALCFMCKLFMEPLATGSSVHIDRLLLCEVIKINCPNKTRN